MLVFHWLWFTPTQCLFFIGYVYTHTLHPHNACFSLAMVYTYTMLVFHWLWFTPTQCLFFIVYGLHPHNACFSLAMVYMHAVYVLHWLQLTPTHFCFSKSISWFYLQPNVPINFICQVHRWSRQYIYIYMNIGKNQPKKVGNILLKICANIYIYIYIYI